MDRAGSAQTRRRHGGWRFVAILMAVALVLAACADEGAETRELTATEEEAVAALHEIFGPGGEDAGEGITLNLGQMLAMTGQGSFFGRVMSRGAAVAAEQIPIAGGPQIEINIADHESGLVPPAVSGVRRLITQDDISALETSYGAPSEAIIPLIQENEVLAFNGGGASPGQTNQDFLWMTRMLFAWDPADGGLAWLAENFPDAKRLAVLGTEENGVETWRDKVPRIWPELQDGGEIVAREIHDVGLTDFSSVIARVKAANADAIFTVSFGDDLGHMVKQFREANVDVPIMGIEFTAQACEIAGEHYDTYHFATDHYDPSTQNPWNQIFVEAHKAEFDEEPEYYGANYYEMTFVIWELIRRVIAAGGDPTSGADLQAALIDNPTFPSVYGGGEGEVGEMTFSLEDRTIDKPMGVFEVEDCQTKQIATIKKISEDEDPASALVSED